jgi:hypothetical protein
VPVHRPFTSFALVSRLELVAAGGQQSSMALSTSSGHSAKPLCCLYSPQAAPRIQRVFDRQSPPGAATCQPPRCTVLKF